MPTQTWQQRRAYFQPPPRGITAAEREAWALERVRAAQRLLADAPGDAAVRAAFAARWREYDDIRGRSA